MDIYQPQSVLHRVDDHTFNRNRLIELEHLTKELHNKLLQRDDKTKEWIKTLQMAENQLKESEAEINQLRLQVQMKEGEVLISKQLKDAQDAMAIEHANALSEETRILKDRILSLEKDNDLLRRESMERDREIAISNNEAEVTRKNLTSLQGQLEEVSQSNRSMKDAHTGYMKDITSMESKNKELVDELSSARLVVGEQEEALSRKDADINNMKLKIVSLVERIKLLESTIETRVKDLEGNARDRLAVIKKKEREMEDTIERTNADNAKICRNVIGDMFRKLKNHLSDDNVTPIQAVHLINTFLKSNVFLPPPSDSHWRLNTNNSDGGGAIEGISELTDAVNDAFNEAFLKTINLYKNDMETRGDVTFDERKVIRVHSISDAHSSNLTSRIVNHIQDLHDLVVINKEKLDTSTVSLSDSVNSARSLHGISSGSNGRGGDTNGSNSNSTSNTASMDRKIMDETEANNMTTQSLLASNIISSVQKRAANIENFLIAQHRSRKF